MHDKDCGYLPSLRSWPCVFVFDFVLFLFFLIFLFLLLFVVVVVVIAEGIFNGPTSTPCSNLSMYPCNCSTHPSKACNKSESAVFVAWASTLTTDVLLLDGLPTPFDICCVSSHFIGLPLEWRGDKETMFCACNSKK